MTELNYETPVLEEEFSKAAPKVDTALENIRAWANGKIDSSNLKAGGVKEESLENKSVGEGKLSAAVQALLGKAVSGLTVKESKISMTAASGELVLMVTTGTVVTLPAPNVNRVVAVFAGTGATITVKAVGASIIGDFENAVAITLRSQQHVTLQAEGNNWLIIAGEPELEGIYAPVSKVATAVKTYESGEYSTSRNTLVNVKVVGVGTENFPVVEVGGVNISGTLSMSVAGSEANLSVIVPPGKKLKVNNGAGANTVNVWTSTLSR
jgi:hypothetical protein